MRVSAATISRSLLRLLPRTSACIISASTPRTSGRLPRTSSLLSVSAQDEWAAAKNLKLTLGIRFDRTGNPECVDNCFSRLSAPFTSSSFQAGVNIPYNQSIDTGLGKAYYSVDSVVPQPRLGVVWSPMGGSNSMVIRAGFGL